jgi:hypothetical protein
MIDAILPRWLIAAAIAAFVLGMGSLYIGWTTWGPVALLAGEILSILAAIVLTTPGIQQSLAAQKATADHQQGADISVSEPTSSDPAAPEAE